MIAKYEHEIIEHSYKIYVTDYFYLQGQNKTYTKRWCDLIDFDQQDEVEKTGEEIVEEVMQAAGLKFGGE